jgi:DNA polymerase III delta prime subunit
VNLKYVRTTVSFDELWVQPLAGTITSNAIGRIMATDDREIFQFITGMEPALIKIRDREFCMDLNFHLKRGCAHLAQVMQGTKDNSFFMMKISFFRTAAEEMGVVEVGIDKRIEDTARHHHERFNNQDDLVGILAKKCIITDGKNTWFIIKTGNTRETEYSQDDSNESGDVISGDAFSICGDGFVIPVIKRRLDEFTEIFFATKIVYNNRQNDAGALTLVKGSLLFSGLAKRIQPIAARALQNLEKQDENYLKAWDQYGEIEGDFLLRKARDIGIIKYSNVEKISNGFKFYVDEDISDALNESDELTLAKLDELPDYLSNKEMTWKEYIEKLEEEFKEGYEEKGKDVFAGEGGEKLEDDNDKRPIEPSVNNNNNESGKNSFRIVNISDRSIILKGLDIDPPKGMGLVLSIMGDLVQIERRMKARLAVKEGRSGNPLLGLIIEEGGVVPEIGRATKMNPLSPFVKDKIFNKNPPTDRQKEAIDIALNTPDIALIQGPPGTGKTTVITAILERLNEEYDKKNSIRGKILVSGFQHDAVDNIISRLSINSLPAIKFGQRSGGSEENDNVSQKRTEEWISEVTEEIQKKNPEIRPLEEQKKLQILFKQYAVSPAKNTAFDIIDLILSLPRKYITADIVADADAIRQSLQDDHRPINREIPALIRALRITEYSFVDDGQYNAMRLLVSMQNQLSQEEVAVLNKAASWKPGDPLAFLVELADLQNTLIKRFTMPPAFTIEKPRKEILNLIEKVNTTLAKRKGYSSKKEEVLANFLYELETNPEGIREAIKDYVFVYGATTQGAEGKGVRKAKKVNSRENAIRFDTVIIDEAARASPRDLLIPMAQAEKRIILVGDHRQLPHIVDDEIIRIAMTEEANKRESEDTSIPNNKVEYYIKHSMFEYLKKRVEGLSAKDGVKRTVTLDKQYRTHPLLGNFINQYFYDHPGEDFGSPLPEEYFKHDLSGMDGKPVLWINVDGGKGKEERVGFSCTRRQEAVAIARQLKIWIDSEEGKQLTFGVISFYRAQCDLVLEELGKQGITERISGQGTWEIKDEYAYLTKENGRVEERLRIGTVDAFQGMEFDAVFLSMVRSPGRIPNYKDEKLMINIFGHLMSENRLCVSMSRQKKVLVIAGNAALAQSNIGRSAVPALAAFCDLCKNEGNYYDFV